MKFRDISNRIRWSSVLFSVLFSLALVTGQVMYDTNSLSTIRNSKYELVWFILRLIIVFGISFFIIVLLLYSLSKVTVKESKYQWTFFANKFAPIYIWAIIFICWVPCLLAYWPGIFAYDIPYQTQVVLKLRDLTSFQPPLHTWIWALCMFLGEKTGFEASTVYASVSMLFISLCYAELVVFINKCFSNNIISTLCLVFLALFPVFPLMAINPTKDGFFSGFFTLFIIKLCEIVSNNTISKKDIVVLSVLGIFSCLFRNNTIYVLTVSFILILIFARKYRILVIVSFLSVIIPVMIINRIIYPALGVKDNEWAANDSLAIPVQQIAAVVVNEFETLTDEQVDAINAYMPVEYVKENYNPRISDPIAHTVLTFDNEGGVKGFIKLWLELLPKHFNTYVDAFLAQNIGFWYPLADSFDKFIKQPYIATDIYFAEGVPTFSRESKLPLLYSFYEVIAWHYFIDKIPIISNVFSISTPLWIILLSICLTIIRNKNSFLSVLCPIFILWANYLICPAAIFRFVYPIVAIYPILIFMPFDDGVTTKYHQGKLHDTI